MPSLIESLIGSSTTRPDKKRLVPTRRPMPTRPRDIFALFTSLGGEASLPSFFQSTELHAAEPRTLTFAALGRWPTEAEFASLPTPYNPQAHLRAMLVGVEFRASLVRRICEAFPERPRLCFVQIPRCAGAHFLATADQMHPVLPPALAAMRRDGQASFIAALGGYLGRFTLTKTITLVQPTLAPFVQANPVPADPSLAETGFQWNPSPPPRRTGDRLFAILREPASLILSHVNATLDALLQPAQADTPAIAAWRTRLPQNPAAADAAGLKLIAREILRRTTLRNPICHALADGTAAAAFNAVRLHDVELTDLSRYPDWVKYTWDVEPDSPAGASTPRLTLMDLSPPEREHLESLVAEDLRFYAPVRTALDRQDAFRNAVHGREL